MVDIALTHDRPALLSSAPMRRSHRADRSFKRLTFACALFVLLMFAGIIMALVAGAWPALGTFGFGFLVSEAWNPVRGCAYARRFGVA
jgi:phosphate transport system permease protein